MKKQIIAAAIAASMSAVALADISITGKAEFNYTHTDLDSAGQNDSDKFKQDMQINLKGKSGDSEVVMVFGGTDNTGSASAVSTFNVEDAYLSTKIADVSIKTGQWDNGDNELRASSRAGGKFSASTSFGPIGVTYDAANEANDTVKVSASMGPVSASYKDVKTGEDVTLAASMSGVSVNYLALNRDTANTDRSVVTVSGEVAGVGIRYGQAKADSATCIDGNSWMGDFENGYACDSTNNTNDAYDLSKGQDVTTLELKTSLAGNTVTFRNTNIDGVTGEDTSFNKFIVTRPLANGTTFEATYTALSDDGANTQTDGNTLDLELRVAF